MLKKILVLMCVALSMIGATCEQGDFIVLGDSLSSGFMPNGGQNWVQLLRQDLDEEIWNAACNSATSATYLIRVGETHVGYACQEARGSSPVELTSSAYDRLVVPDYHNHNIKWAILFIGAGDSLFTGSCADWAPLPCNDVPITQAEHEANIRELMDRLWFDENQTGLLGFLLVTPPYFRSGIENFFPVNQNIDTYHEANLAICADDSRARCLPNLDLRDVLGASDYSTDLLHFDQSGHEKIRDRFLPVLSNL